MCVHVAVHSETSQYFIQEAENCKTLIGPFESFGSPLSDSNMLNVDGDFGTITCQHVAVPLQVHKHLESGYLLTGFREDAPSQLACWADLSTVPE